MKEFDAKTPEKLAEILGNPEDYQKQILADAQIQYDMDKGIRSTVKKLGVIAYQEKAERYIKSLGNPAFITERKLKALPPSLLLTDKQKTRILHDALKGALGHKSSNQTDYSGYMDF